MKMKGPVHKQKTFTDPKIGKRAVFLVLSVMTFIKNYEWKNRRAHCMASPPYENVHVGLFHSYLKETKKKINCQLIYNLISYHFHTKSKGKQS